LEIFREFYTDIEGKSGAWKDCLPEVDSLRFRVRTLERELREKEAVIQELSQAAADRLELIKKFDRSAQS
jgi:hypothetical protein